MDMNQLHNGCIPELPNALGAQLRGRGSVELPIAGRSVVAQLKLYLGDGGLVLNGIMKAFSQSFHEDRCWDIVWYRLNLSALFETRGTDVRKLPLVCGAVSGSANFGEPQHTPKHSHIDARTNQHALEQLGSLKGWLYSDCNKVTAPNFDRQDRLQNTEVAAKALSGKSSNSIKSHPSSLEDMFQIEALHEIDLIVTGRKTQHRIFNELGCSAGGSVKFH